MAALDEATAVAADFPVAAVYSAVNCPAVPLRQLLRWWKVRRGNGLVSLLCTDVNELSRQPMSGRR